MCNEDDVGMTLIELLVVITIIGILSTLGVVGYTKYRENAHNAGASLLATSVFSKLGGIHENITSKYLTPAASSCMGGGNRATTPTCSSYSYQIEETVAHFLDDSILNDPAVWINAGVTVNQSAGTATRFAHTVACKGNVVFGTGKTT